MKLKDWLKQESKTPIWIMNLLECNRVRAWRILNGKAMPDREEMVKVFIDTRGQVQPNDFYDLPKIKLK